MKEPKVQHLNSHLYSMSKVLALKNNQKKKGKKERCNWLWASYQPQSTSIILIYSSSFMHFFLASFHPIGSTVRFQHVFLSLRSKTKKSVCLYKKWIIPLNGSREVHQFCLGCHEKPPKIQYNKILWLSWHIVTFSRS